MKKAALIVILVLGAVIVACDKQKALDSILDDPDMKSYMLKQMLSDELTRAELADSVFADDEITMAYLDGMAENELSRAHLLEHILKADSTGEWIIGKLAENPDIKKVMKKAVRR